jgi:protein-L-isoaspartate(D-aspartate) O-methyltransferase
LAAGISGPYSRHDFGATDNHTIFAHASDISRKIARLAQQEPFVKTRRPLFLTLSLAALTFSLASFAAIQPFSADLAPPEGSAQDFSTYMEKARSEDPGFLAKRWNRLQAMIKNKDVADDRDRRAFLLTPREEFVRPINRTHAYDSAFLDIGYGVTISGPHLVGHMTQALDVKQGEKVLEVGTGSGYQSAYLSHLTDKVYTIEIIKPLAERTRGVYDDLIKRGYNEFKSITTKQADGYYGWEQNAPFDKIIVTCGIDHIPPPLLKQLKVGGVMVIPVGPPGAQRVLKVVKQQGADGSITVTRSDIYNGKIVPFVPFTKLEGDVIKGAHNGDQKDKP